MAWHHRAVGRVARLYWRLYQPRTLGVRAIVLDSADRIALVQHTYIGGWYLPGGGVKKDEGFAAATRREVCEEVGLADVTIECILGLYQNRREGKDDHIAVFVVRAADAGVMHVADALEIAEARWFALDALPVDLSPASARRIADYHAGVIGDGDW